MLMGQIEGLAAFQSFACCERVNPLPGETEKPQGWERSNSNPTARGISYLEGSTWRVTEAPAPW